MDFALLDAELAEMFALMYDMRDSLPDDYPEQFERRLQESLLDPVSFRYPFSALIDAGMNVVSSDDGRVRIFYWLHPGTGSHWLVPTLLQASTPEGIIVHNTRSLDTADNESFGYWDFHNTPDIAYQQLHTLTDSTYLAIGGGQAMASLPWISAVGLAVRDRSITLGFPLFRQNDGRLEEEVGLVLSWYWYHPGEGDELYPSMAYDPTVRELSFPEMTAAAADRRTDRRHDPPPLQRTVLRTCRREVRFISFVLLRALCAFVVSHTASRKVHATAQSCPGIFNRYT